MYYEKIKKVPIYRGYWGIVITDERKTLRHKRGTKISKGNEVYAHTHYGEYKEYGCILFIFNPNNSFTKLGHDSISHEIIHGVDMVFELKDMKWDLVDDEPAAYLAGYFAKHIYKFFKEQKIEIK